MCGRYSLWDIKQIEEIQRKSLVGYKLQPRYNAAPGQLLPVITEEGMEPMKWGLVPSWAKEPTIGYKMINARSEGIEKKPAYGRLLKSHRCLVPANGFYEWKTNEKGKTPYYITVKNKPLFYFAGLWDHWFDAEKKEFKTFTIITTKPNSFMAKIHDRMPVILESDEEKPWLEEKEYIDFKQVLDAYPENRLQAWPVSTLVNKPQNDNPELIKKLA